MKAFNPQRVFISWASSHSCSVLDTWKWDKDGQGDKQRHTGLARIPADQADALLRVSGLGSFYVDAFRDTTWHDVART